MRLELMSSEERNDGRLTEAGREDQVLDLLQGIRDVDAPHAVRVAAVKAYLKDAQSSLIRGYAALALVDLEGPKAAADILDVLRRPGAAEQSGTLLFALSEIEASLPLEIAAATADRGSYEAQNEVLAAVEEGRILPFDHDVEDHAVAIVTPLLKSTDGPTAELANRLLEFIMSERRVR